jgi:pimeloyl-ACP methyl ester carboxylesterase
MPSVELSAGTIEYADTGGTGPVLVFVHGLLMNGSGWRHVVERLAPRYRCVVPDLPLGAHRLPMKPDADLSLRGLALLVGEFLDRLDLTDVTLIQNDWGGAQVLLAEGPSERIGRLVLTACEAFDNYPPAPARPIAWLARVPGTLALLTKLLRWRPVQRAPRLWGWMSKRPVPADIADGWFRPAATDARIRRDLAKYVTSIPDRATLLDWAARAGRFPRPVLIVWAREDRMFPRDHGQRLAELFPDARLVEIADSYTLLAEDQPGELTEQLERFLTETGSSASEAADRRR